MPKLQPIFMCLKVSFNEEGTPNGISGIATSLLVSGFPAKCGPLHFVMHVAEMPDPVRFEFAITCARDDFVVCHGTADGAKLDGGAAIINLGTPVLHFEEEGEYVFRLWHEKNQLGEFRFPVIRIGTNPSWTRT